ncbi:MAG: TetR/AcrR family transcriptional regulator [Myxococcota bacterium]|nr:TetR/AcrR family transcriptional regulator [Myxococcota bacterium]
MTRHLPQAEREEQILRAARKVFIEKGFEKTRMSDVAGAAGLSKGAVYFYFDSKQALIQALASQEHQRAQAILDEVLAHRDLAAEQNLTDLLRMLLHHFLTLRRRPRFFMLVSELATRDELQRANFLETHNRLMESIVAVVSQGIEDGTFRKVDPHVVAAVLKASSDGLTLERAIGADPVGEPEHIIQETIDLFLHGVLPPESA